MRKKKGSDKSQPLATPVATPAEPSASPSLPLAPVLETKGRWTTLQGFIRSKSVLVCKWILFAFLCGIFVSRFWVFGLTEAHAPHIVRREWFVAFVEFGWAQIMTTFTVFGLIIIFVLKVMDWQHTDRLARREFWRKTIDQAIVVTTLALLYVSGAFVYDRDKKLVYDNASLNRDLQNVKNDASTKSRQLEYGDLLVRALNESIQRSGEPSLGFHYHPIEYMYMHDLWLSLKAIPNCQIRFRMRSQPAMEALFRYAISNPSMGNCRIDTVPVNYPIPSSAGVYIYGNSDRGPVKVLVGDFGVHPKYVPVPSGYSMEGDSAWIDIGTSIWE